MSKLSTDCRVTFLKESGRLTECTLGISYKERFVNILSKITIWGEEKLFPWDDTLSSEGRSHYKRMA